MAQTELLSEIERFLEITGMAASYFGEKACGNSKLVLRLRDGRPIETGTLEKVRAFIAEETGRRRDEAQRFLRSTAPHPAAEPARAGA